MSSEGHRANQELACSGPAAPGWTSSPELAWENDGGHLLPDDADLAVVVKSNETVDLTELAVELAG